MEKIQQGIAFIKTLVETFQANLPYAKSDTQAFKCLDEVFDIYNHSTPGMFKHENPYTFDANFERYEKTSLRSSSEGNRTSGYFLRHSQIYTFSSPINFWGGLIRKNRDKEQYYRIIVSEAPIDKANSPSEKYFFETLNDITKFGGEEVSMNYDIVNSVRNIIQFFNALYIPGVAKHENPYFCINRGNKVLLGRFLKYLFSDMIAHYQNESGVTGKVITSELDCKSPIDFVIPARTEDRDEAESHLLTNGSDSFKTYYLYKVNLSSKLGPDPNQDQDQDRTQDQNLYYFIKTDEYRLTDKVIYVCSSYTFFYDTLEAENDFKSIVIPDFVPRRGYSAVSYGGSVSNPFNITYHGNASECNSQNDASK